MKKIFVGQHVRKKDSDNENVKMIGVFTTQKAADASIRKLGIQLGFKEHLDGFSVDEYELDKTEWREGFVV